MDIGMHSGLIQEAKRFYCSNHHGNTQVKHPRASWHSVWMMK